MRFLNWVILVISFLAGVFAGILLIALLDVFAIGGWIVGSALMFVFIASFLINEWLLKRENDLIVKGIAKLFKVSLHRGEVDGQFPPPKLPVRVQGFWNQELGKLRKSSAHLVGLIMRRVVCDASAAFRVSFV